MTKIPPVIKELIAAAEATRDLALEKLGLCSNCLGLGCGLCPRETGPCRDVTDTVAAVREAFESSESDINQGWVCVSCGTRYHTYVSLCRCGWNGSLRQVVGTGRKGRI